jgi:hypothetical protein
MSASTVAVVVYCPRCDYHLHIAVPPDAVGSHGCMQCDKPMGVYIAQGCREVVQWHRETGHTGGHEAREENTDA